MWHVNVSKQRMVQLQGAWCWLRASPMLTGVSVGQSAVKGTCQWSVLWLRWYTQQSAPEDFTWLLWLFVNFFYYSYSSRNKHFSPCTASSIRRAFQSYWNKMNNNRRGKGLLLKGAVLRRDGEMDGIRVMAKSVGCLASSMTAQPQEAMCEAQQHRMNDGAHIWRLSACSYNKSQLDAYDRL